MPSPTSGEDAGREHNFILAALPDAEYARLRERLEPVEIGLKDMIYETDQPISHAYFPTTAVLSMISQVDGEVGVEVATIGREGMAGLPVFLGVGASPNTVFGQIPGVALRMRAEHLRDVLAGDGALHRQLHRYIQATMVQLSQNVACNRLHSTEERAARWLLMTADRVGAERFLLTQEFLAQMLGVRRATVSITAGLLQNAGLISYTRGVITIDDRAGLEDAACDCYQIVRAEFERLARRAADPDSRAEAAGERAEQVREAARAAHERSTRARERGEQIAERLTELKTGVPPSTDTVARASALSASAAEAAEEAEQLAARGYEHAAHGLERAADAHEHLADLLQRRADTVSGEEADELRGRAREHRAQAAADRQESRVDRQAADDVQDS